jgi:monoamine oxidase
MARRAIVIGGGIAGLAAADELSSHGCEVLLLEARERLGGRIWTIRGKTEIPIELGAEFIHGEPAVVCSRLAEARLATHVVPSRHWRFQHGKLEELSGLEDELGGIIDQIDPDAPDYSFAKVLRRSGAPREAKELARDYVEGFHAARIEEASAKAVALSEQKSEETHGDTQFRIAKGYAALVDWFEERCRGKGVQILPSAVVRGVEWRPGHVLCGVEINRKFEQFSAPAAIVTLPLGVLQKGVVEFNPPLDRKTEAIRDLRSGVVVKIILEFARRFWPEPNFGFIHSDDEWLPTWWADERGNVLTGWAGGSKGERLSRCDKEFIVERALEALSRIFGDSQIRGLLLRAHVHNWADDPFSRGAYSYIPVNGIDAIRELARPLENTLFFAGEATNVEYEVGTVHGAMATGLRAAREFLM